VGNKGEEGLLDSLASAKVARAKIKARLYNVGRFDMELRRVIVIVVV
jgi:hypothetical protein